MMKVQGFSFEWILFHFEVFYFVHEAFEFHAHDQISSFYILQFVNHTILFSLFKRKIRITELLEAMISSFSLTTWL